MCVYILYIYIWYIWWMWTNFSTVPGMHIKQKHQPKPPYPTTNGPLPLPPSPGTVTADHVFQGLAVPWCKERFVGLLKCTAQGVASFFSACCSDMFDLQQCHIYVWYMHIYIHIQIYIYIYIYIHMVCIYIYIYGVYIYICICIHIHIIFYHFMVIIYSNTPPHHFPSSHSADDASWMPWIDTTRAQERIMPFLLDPAW